MDTKEDGRKEVTAQMINAGKFYKKTVELGGKQYVAHRLSIEEKIKVGVLTSQRTNEMKVDDMTYNLAYAASWLDVSLNSEDNPDWQGSPIIYDTSFLMDLYHACWNAVEKPFFRSKPAGSKTEESVKTDNE